MNKTIYIAIPSIMDTEIVPTIKNAFDAADNPDRVFVGVSFLDKSKKDFKKVEQMSKENSNISCDFHKLKRKDISMIGVGKGRYRAASFYNNQDLFLQIDSHTMFLQGWDTKIVDLYEEFEKIQGNDRFVLTGYLADYKYDHDGNRVSSLGNIMYPFFRDDDFLIDLIPKWHPDLLPETVSDKFVPSIKFNANFALGGKSFIENYGLEKNSIFFTEEILQTLNLFKNKINLVYPNVDRFPLFHLYINDVEDKNGYRVPFSDSLSEKNRNIVYNIDKSVYLKYIGSPENKDIIDNYQKYAKINLRKGVVKINHIPKKFISEEF